MDTAFVLEACLLATAQMGKVHWLVGPLLSTPAHSRRHSACMRRVVSSNARMWLAETRSPESRCPRGKHGSATLVTKRQWLKREREDQTNPVTANPESEVDTQSLFRTTHVLRACDCPRRPWLTRERMCRATRSVEKCVSLQAFFHAIAADYVLSSR